MSRPRSRALFALVALVASAVAWLAPGMASAHMGEEKFRIERKVSKPPDGPRGQADVRALDGSHEVRLLRGDAADYVGSFEVRNTGPGPLTVNRVFVAGADDDPRAAPGIVVVGEGNTRGPLAPGEARRYDVTWRSDQARALQVDAAVVVDSDAAQPDATVVDPSKLIGIQANRRLGLARYALSALVFSPLLLVLLAGASRVVRSLEPRVVRGLVGAVLLFETGLAGWVLAAFDPLFGKRDGNEGLQFVEHAIVSRSAALEYGVGVDGWSIALVFLVAGIALIGALSLDVTSSGFRRRVAGLGVLAFGAMLALVAQNLVLFSFALVAAGAASTLFVFAEGKGARPAAIQLGVATAVSLVFLIAATVLIGKYAGATYLVDGSDAARTYGFADIARSKLVQHIEPLAGMPAYRTLWLLTFLGLAPYLPVVPFHPWLRSAAMGRSASVVGAILPALAGYGILRLCIATQPEGARWAAESLPVVGAALLAWGALLALVEPDLRRAVANLAMGRAGLFLFFTFALTPEGIDAGLALAVGGAMAAALAFATSNAIAIRLGDGRVSSVSGIGRAAPVLGAGLVVGSLSLGAPVLPGAWSALVGVIGAFGKNPALTVGASAALAVAAVASARLAATAFGPVPSSWRTNKVLEPFGGAPPDARGKELSFVVPLLVAIIAFGFVPRALLGGAEQPIRELWPRLDPPGPTQVV